MLNSEQLTTAYKFALNLYDTAWEQKIRIEEMSEEDRNALYEIEASQCVMDMESNIESLKLLENLKLLKEQNPHRSIQEEDEVRNMTFLKTNILLKYVPEELVMQSRTGNVSLEVADTLQTLGHGNISSIAAKMALDF